MLLQIAEQGGEFLRGTFHKARRRTRVLLEQLLKHLDLPGQQSFLPATAAVNSGEEATQANVPRRSRLQRYEQKLDAWFA